MRDKGKKASDVIHMLSLGEQLPGSPGVMFSQTSVH